MTTYGVRVVFFQGGELKRSEYIPISEEDLAMDRVYSGNYWKGRARRPAFEYQILLKAKQFQRDALHYEGRTPKR